MLDVLDADNIVVLRSNPVYRIGDVVRRTGLRWKHDRNQILGRNEFKDSILHYYLSRKRFERDYRTLLEAMLLARANHSYLTPLSNEAVIHLRAGDVVDDPRFLSRDFIKIIKQLPATIMRITVVTAMHFGDFRAKQLFIYSHEKEQRNRNHLRTLFTAMRNNFSATQFNLLSTASADQSLTYISTAPFLIGDFGGFSDVCRRLRLQMFNHT